MSKHRRTQQTIKRHHSTPRSRATPAVSVFIGNEPPPSPLLSPIDAARYIGMSPDYLKETRKGRSRGRGTPGPAFVRVGARRVRYAIKDLDAWLQANRVECR